MPHRDSRDCGTLHIQRDGPASLMEGFLIGGICNERARFYDGSFMYGSAIGETIEHFGAPTAVGPEAFSLRA